MCIWCLWRRVIPYDTNFFFNFFFIFYVHRWLYRPDVQQLSGRKTRRTDPVITTNITTTTTPASMATSVTTGVAIPTARDTGSALRTIPEGEMSGGEESESDLTQPQFVTQPDLTQSVVVAPSTRGNTFLY